jgi:hypothetical protein
MCGLSTCRRSVDAAPVRSRHHLTDRRTIVTKSLYTSMLSMRTRTAFPRDWRRVDGDTLQRIIAELDRGRAFADRARR